MKYGIIILKMKRNLFILINCSKYVTKTKKNKKVYIERKKK